MNIVDRLVKIELALRHDGTAEGVPSARLEATADLKKMIEELKTGGRSLMDDWGVSYVDEETDSDIRQAIGKAFDAIESASDTRAAFIVGELAGRTEAALDRGRGQ